MVIRIHPWLKIKLLDHLHDGRVHHTQHELRPDAEHKHQYNGRQHQQRSDNVRSGICDQRPFNGPQKTRWMMVSRKIAVTSRPSVDNAAAQGASGNAPLKIRNSPTNPFNPGSPSDENSAMPIKPVNTGTILRMPPKSSNPRKPPLRFSMSQTNRNSTDAVSHD